MAKPSRVVWLVLVKSVAVVVCDYSAGVPVEVVSEQVVDAF